MRTHALQAGDQHPLGVGAGSLAMLAALPDDEIAEIIETNRAILDARYPAYSPAQLRTEIALTRRQGFALNPGHIVASSWGVGVPVRYPDGRVAGALSIAAIDSRMQPQRQEELAVVLRHEAREVETRIVAMLERRTKPEQPAQDEIRTAETTP